LYTLAPHLVLRLADCGYACVGRRLVGFGGVGVMGRKRTKQRRATGSSESLVGKTVSIICVTMRHRGSVFRFLVGSLTGIYLVLPVGHPELN
jgi:hypothetical protein